MRLLPVTLAISLAAAGLILQGCATKPVVYGPIGPEAPHGYADRQNPDGGFTVKIAMPGQSAPAELRNFFDRRAAELCPAGVERTNVFRLDRGEQFMDSNYVYGSVGFSQRIAIGNELEGYVYCKPGKEGAATEAAPAS